jgi:hypothetical protein
VDRAVRTAAVALAALVLVPADNAAVLLGVHGHSARFKSQTGQTSQIQHLFVSFGQGNALSRIAASAGPVPMLALNSGSYGQAQTATPRGLALGQNDQFLFQLNSVVFNWPGERFYVRPFPR